MVSRALRINMKRETKKRVYVTIEIVGIAIMLYGIAWEMVRRGAFMNLIESFEGVVYSGPEFVTIVGFIIFSIGASGFMMNFGK